jgi:deoxyxylulose-5-phosphate synthase
LQAAKKIITIEENVLAGGMGSYILELLSDNQMVKPVKRLGLQFKNGYYDKFISREYVREEQGLSEASIEKAIREMVG